MAITFVDSSTVDLAAAKAITLPVPNAAQADDFMLAFVKQCENTTARNWDDDGGGGNGWTLLTQNRTTGGRDMETAIYYKTHDGSESNPTFTWWAEATTNEPISGSLLVYRGVSTVEPIAAWAYANEQNDSNPPNPAVRISQYPVMAVVLHGATHDDITAPAAPTGFDMRAQVWAGVNNDHRNIFAADQLLTSGITATYTPPDWGHTASNNTPEYHTYTVALQEPQAIALTDWPDSLLYGGTYTVTGYGFGETQGVGSLQLWSDEAGTIKVNQSIANWSENSITFNITRGTLDDDVSLRLVITNANGDATAGLQITVGLAPYPILMLHPEVDHLWPFNGDYEDLQGGNTINQSIVGGGVFQGVQIAEGSPQSWFADNARRSPVNSNAMNEKVTVNRTMGGWIQLNEVTPQFTCLYEEGGGVNNLAFFLGVGNILVAQLADTDDDNVQAFSDFALEPGRPYHIAFRFSYTDAVKEFRLYIDGVLQQVTSGNPLQSPDLDQHPGNVTFGGSAGSLEVSGTNVIFSLSQGVNFSQWFTFSTSQPASLLETFFKRGAVPDAVLTGTQSDMQSQLDALANTALPNRPLSIRVLENTDGPGCNLVANNVTFNAATSMFLEYRGAGTLNWTNLNGSNLVDSKVYASKGGTVAITTPATLTLTGLLVGSEVRIFDASTGDEIGGVESSGSTFSLSVEAASINVSILSLARINQFIKGLVITGDTTLPIQQLTDRQYRND